ncbi:MAG: alpha-D-ribose 1-methylphosphonate 5-phosphate C-P-lyase PhnJ, partial [Burkholderiaceae bacterium]
MKVLVNERKGETGAEPPQGGLAPPRGVAVVSHSGGLSSLGYNFAYLDENTKRSIRRALLKAVAIPGHQVPFGSREMPLA